MSCTSCGGKGYIEGYQARDAAYCPSLEQCPRRCNITGYSDEVRKRMSWPERIDFTISANRAPAVTKSEETGCKVIPFRRKETLPHGGS